MFFFALFCAAFSVSAQPGTPSNDAEKVNPTEILIGHFLFTRPDNWQWVETRLDLPNVMQSVTFDIKFPKGSCRAYFNHFKPNKPPPTARRLGDKWQDLFVGVRRTGFTEPKTIGTNRISYIKIIGTFKAEKREPEKANFGLDGALVEDPRGNLVMRVMRPAELIEENHAAFHKMLENALRSEQ